MHHMTADHSSHHGRRKLTNDTSIKEGSKYDWCVSIHIMVFKYSHGIMTLTDDSGMLCHGTPGLIKDSKR